MSTTAQPDRGTSDQVEDAANSRPAEGFARFGLAARAAVYLLVGVLAVELALGERRGETDQRGALQDLASHSGGEVLVWLIAAGLFGYALWRLKDAVFGVQGEDSDKGDRIAAAAQFVVYAGIGVSAVEVAMGARRSQSGQQQQLSARIFHHDGGRWVVGIAGVAVIVCGAYLVRQGLTKAFAEHLDRAAMTPRQRRVVDLLGVIGTTARGVVIALAGVFVIVAAVRADPKKAGGLDQALRELLGTTGGPVLLCLVAAGLIAFGLYGMAEARWRRT